MKNNYKIVIVVASLTTLAVVLGGVSSTIIVHVADANEKADSQSEKDHVKQADRTCEKEGYDGYLGENGQGDCGYLK